MSTGIQDDQKIVNVEAKGLRQIPTADISPNPQNPRMFFPPNTLEVLCDSISKVGILMPLLVYETKNGKYVILDGERRWKCAQRIGLEKVPVNIIAEPNTITNLLTMFNIHNIRESWQVMPAALKLEVIMRILKTTSERKLSKLTGLKAGQIRRLKTLLAYPKNYQDLMLKAGEKDVTADFFSELYPVFSLLKRYLPEINEKYSQDIIIEKLLSKQRKGIIKAGREFRILSKIIRAVDKGSAKKSIQDIVERVLTDPQLSIPEAFEISVKDRYETESLKKHAENIIELLSSKYIILADAPTLNTLRMLQERISEILSSKS